MNDNDKKILQLKEEIKKKKALIKKTKFDPITNCNLKFQETSFNLHVITEETVLYLIASLNALKRGLEDLIPEEDLKLSGYSIQDWLTDLLSKYQSLKITNEVKKLASLENKLQSLLTNETQINLELKDIENTLK